MKASFILGVSADLATGLAYMHSYGIAHGDIFGHNVLVSKCQNTSLGDGSFARLFDFGASFLYPRKKLGWSFVEAAEVRAFGLLLKDMTEYLHVEERLDDIAFLRGLAIACSEWSPLRRPQFNLILSALIVLRDEGLDAAARIIPIIPVET